MKIEQFVVKGSGACLLTETAAAAYDAFLSRKLEIYRHRFTNVYISGKGASYPSLSCMYYT